MTDVNKHDGPEIESEKELYPLVLKKLPELFPVLFLLAGVLV